MTVYYLIITIISVFKLNYYYYYYCLLITITQCLLYVFIFLNIYIHVYMWLCLCAAVYVHVHVFHIIVLSGFQVSRRQHGAMTKKWKGKVSKQAITDLNIWASPFLKVRFLNRTLESRHQDVPLTRRANTTRKSKY